MSCYSPTMHGTGDARCGACKRHRCGHPRRPITGVFSTGAPPYLAHLVCGHTRQVDKVLPPTLLLMCHGCRPVKKGCEFVPKRALCWNAEAKQ